MKRFGGRGARWRRRSLLIALSGLALAAVPFRRNTPTGGCDRSGRGTWIIVPSFGELGTEIPPQGTVGVTQQHVWTDPSGSMVTWNGEATSTLVSFSQPSGPVEIEFRPMGRGITTGTVLEIDEVNAARLSTGPHSSDGVFDIPLMAFPAGQAKGTETAWRVLDHGACSVSVPWSAPAGSSPPFGTVAGNLNVGFGVDQPFAGGDGIYVQLCHLGISMRPIFEDTACTRGDYAETRFCTQQNDRIITTIGLSGAFAHRLSALGGYDLGAGVKGFLQYELRPAAYPTNPFADRIRLTNAVASSMFHDAPTTCVGSVCTPQTADGPLVWNIEGSSSPFFGPVVDFATRTLLNDVVTDQVNGRIRDIERRISCALSVPMIRPVALLPNLAVLPALTRGLMQRSCALNPTPGVGCTSANPDDCVQTCDISAINPCAQAQSLYATTLVNLETLMPTGPFYANFGRYLNRVPNAFECRPANVGPGGVVPSGTPGICALRLPLSRAQITPGGIEVVLAEDLPAMPPPATDSYLLTQALGEIAGISLCSQPRPPSPLVIGSNARTLVAVPAVASLVGDIASDARANASSGTAYSCRMSASDVERLSVCFESNVGTGRYARVYDPSTFCTSCMAANCSSQMNAMCIERWGRFRQGWLQNGFDGHPPPLGTFVRQCWREQEALGEECTAQFRDWEICRAANCANDCR